jgi:hypothetical protein
VILTVNVCGEELPQLLLAVTETVPPAEPAVAMMLVVADVPVQPLGNDHVYDMAPVTAAIENVSRPPLQIAARPVIVPGVAGEDAMLTANVCVAELPHALFAVTETVPAVELAVAMMLVVADVPVHPFGNDHV